MKYNLVLIEKYGTDGITLEEATEMLNMLISTVAYPIELEAYKHACSAMGFIDPEYADSLEYDYSGLHDFIAGILDDMEQESLTHTYNFGGGMIYLTRNIYDLPSEWIQTDDMQYCKKIDELKYELIEANEVDGKYIISEPMIIDLNEYLLSESEERYPIPEAVSIIESYYKTVDRFIEEVPDKDTRYQYLAEMIYESTSQFLPDCNYQRLLTGDEAEEIMREYCKSGEISDIIYAGIEE